jgi:hypothetical protein
MSWDEVTALQQALILRKQQLRVLEPNVYAVRRKVDGQFEYLGYDDGESEGWVSLSHPTVAIYPSHGVADYVRGHHEGSTVITIPKEEFRTLPAFGRHLKMGVVDERGNYNG